MTATTTQERRTVRLGHDLSGIADIDTAIKAADLDWGLNIIDGDTPLSFIGADGNAVVTSFPGQRLVQRDDTHVTLGVVGGRYQDVDNRQVFGLGRHILDQGGVLVSGGPLDHGRRAFMKFDLPSAKISLDGKNEGKDLLSFGVTLRANHDGKGNVAAHLEAKRLICTNGMTVSLTGLPRVFRIRHTASAEQRLAEAVTILQGAQRYAKEFTATAQHMLDTPFTLAQFRRYIERIWPEPNPEEKRAHTLWENRRADLLGLFRFAETNALGRNTAWGAFNSVTEYLDWNAPVRSATSADVALTRAVRQFDESNQDIKDAAFALLVR